MEREYELLIARFRQQLEDRGCRRVESIDRGLRGWFVLDGEPGPFGVKLHGIKASGSCLVGRVPFLVAGRFTFGAVPHKDEVCLRRMAMDPVDETPIAVRLDTSWLDEAAFMQRLVWLFHCAVLARQAFEQGIERLQVWTPPTFDPVIADQIISVRGVQ